MKIKIEKQNILNAHSVGSSTAKAVIENLFPEVFKKEMQISFEEEGFYVEDELLLAERSHGEYANKAFYLSDNYDWEVKIDSDGLLCLIPTPKKKYITAGCFLAK